MRSRSLTAPVLILPSITCSAARPPSVAHTRSNSCSCGGWEWGERGCARGWGARHDESADGCAFAAGRGGTGYGVYGVG